MSNNKLPDSRSVPYRPKFYWWEKIKIGVRQKLIGFPKIEQTISMIYHARKSHSWKIRWSLRRLVSAGKGINAENFDPDKIYWLSPQKIVFSSLREFNIHDFKGCVIGGDWDGLVKRFDDLDIYVALRQVCLEGKRWADTVFYRRVLECLNRGNFIFWGCQNQEDLDKRCDYVESLFASIRNDGYKSQRELFLSGRVTDLMTAEEEVTVCIGRFGDFLFSDGAHRLAIAKLLGIPAIPVKIAVRHKDWMAFRHKLRSYAAATNIAQEAKLYPPITHPDLSDIPVLYPREDRFQLIKNNTSFSSGSLLDIGAGLGYFCHQFEEIGFDCYAVENDLPTVYLLKHLARAENRTFKVITTSILESSEIRNTHFNVVLALNIFHRLMKTREDFEKLVDLLNNLQMEELFFESCRVSISKPEVVFMSYSPEEFTRFIVNNSRLTNAVLLGTVANGNSLFKLY